MVSFDFTRFLRSGQLLDFSEISTEENIIEELGPPEYIEDYENAGKFLHYGDLRFAIRHGLLTSIEVFFLGGGNRYELYIGNDVLSISSRSSLSKILDYLNQMNLRWEIPYEKSKLDYLVIEIQSGITVYYYLYTSKLERISRHFEMK